MKLKTIALLCVLILSYVGNSQDVNFELNQKLWLEDFEYLKEKVEKTVSSYQNAKLKNAFETVYNTITSSKLKNDKIEIVYAIQRLLNTLNDEGCNVPFFQKDIGLDVLPIKTYWFNDGFFVLDATERDKDIIGQQIVKVNGLDIDEAFKKLKPFINADNEHYKKHLFQVYGLMPSVLKLIGHGDSDNQVELQFASGSYKTLTSNSISEYAKLSRRLPNDEVFSFTNTDYKGQHYWAEAIPNSKTLFVQLQLIANNDEGLSFSNFIDHIEAQLSTNTIDKLILDLRYGGGGNGFKLKRFTDLLRESSVINKKGNLFVFTSKATRGTLLELASILKLNTKATIIGEPTAEGANTVGDMKYITLPNSKIKVSLTHTFWPTSWEQDKSTSLKPDVLVSYDYSKYVNTQDPWLDVVNTFKTTKTHQPIPANLAHKLTGTYKIDGRKITIEEKEGSLFLSMNRKMKSFFEIHTELYYKKEGTLSTDMANVTLSYSKSSSDKIKLESLNWNGIILEIK